MGGVNLLLLDLSFETSIWLLAGSIRYHCGWYLQAEKREYRHRGVLNRSNWPIDWTPNRCNVSDWGLTWEEWSSLLSYHAIGTDIPDPLPPPVSIVHRSRLVFKATFCIGTELFYVGPSWSSYLCLSMWGDPLEYIVYEFVPTSPAVSCMSGSSNLDSFRDGW